MHNSSLQTKHVVPPFLQEPSLLFVTAHAARKLGVCCSSEARLLPQPSLYSRWNGSGRSWCYSRLFSDAGLMFSSILSCMFCTTEKKTFQKCPPWKLVSDGGLEYCHLSSTI